VRIFVDWSKLTSQRFDSITFAKIDTAIVKLNILYVKKSNEAFNGILLIKNNIDDTVQTELKRKYTNEKISAIVKMNKIKIGFWRSAINSFAKPLPSMPRLKSLTIH
jgi:hypothetical protein